MVAEVAMCHEIVDHDHPLVFVAVPDKRNEMVVAEL